MDIDECPQAHLLLLIGSTGSRDEVLFLSAVAGVGESALGFISGDPLVLALRDLGGDADGVEADGGLPLEFLAALAFEVLALLCLEERVLSLHVLGLRHVGLVRPELGARLAVPLFAEHLTRLLEHARLCRDCH